MTQHPASRISGLWKILFAMSALYAVFSYALTDPNLILSSWKPYWQFQQWIWQNVFHNRPLLTSVYSALIVGWWWVYQRGLFFSKKNPPQKLVWREMLVAACFAFSPLLVSYNALSHDVFNYIFNAKMVLLYQANPHVQTALDFARDDWTRFMHNTHTPAPYGYGWTALSLVPYALGMGKFLITWLSFRAFSLLSLGLLAWTYLKTRPHFSRADFWLVFANPLLIIEVISNQHNDVFMMAPAVMAFGLLWKHAETRAPWKSAALSLGLLIVSISIKLATAVLLPLWTLILLRPHLSRSFSRFSKYLSTENGALLASLLLFVPLFTLRSQQFLPWYLIWSLVWLPFIRQEWWRKWVLAFSLSALFRYAPWLWAGEFSPEVLVQQKWVVWGGGALVWLVWWGWSSRSRTRYNKTA